MNPEWIDLSLLAVGTVVLTWLSRKALRHPTLAHHPRQHIEHRAPLARHRV